MMLEKTEGAEAAVREGSWDFSFRPEVVLVTNTCGRLLPLENMHHIPQFASTASIIIS